MGELRISGVLLLLLICYGLVGCGGGDDRSVTIYCSHDRAHSQKILDLFEQETGIAVDAIFDTEATKTVGLAQRVRSEKARPRCDVHWSNEPLHAVRLAADGFYDVLPLDAGEGIPASWRDPDRLWCGFAGRVRVLALAAGTEASESPPTRLVDLAQKKWRGRVAIADPRFGTTASHLAIVRSRVGQQRYRQLLESLRANDVQMVSSNSSSRDRVLSGEAWIGLTDTDDIEVVRRRGSSLGEDFLRGDGVLLLPNVIAIIKGSPHPEEARELARWLLRKEVEETLAASPSRQVPLREEARVPPTGLGVLELDPMEIDWFQAAAQLPDAIREAERILLNH
ncbi:MAG: extracellular solute-binding protein [Planctomycetota bacterium]|nr:extracellular solute-binding protein [Planctomycetota bacterium]